MNEIGWFVAGVEFVLLGLYTAFIWGAYEFAVKQDEKIKEAAKRIERDSREIEDYMRLREKDVEEIGELKENAVALYEAAGLDEDAKFMDVVRLIKKYRQDSEELTAAKERAGKIFITEPGV